MAISMIAVRLSASHPHFASTGCPNGPLTLALISSPLQAASSASMVPSPPSAIGHLINSACGQTSARPLAMASATAWALRLSLNESGAMTIFIVVLHIRYRMFSSRPGFAACPAHNDQRQQSGI
ncbi:hypothetical protein ALP75_202401 [Pseudomonas syringae pv. actinidiae]|nr:hypothetical protein ALP75_202401 [Pseudomonas syringae pv. actinidiae]